MKKLFFLGASLFSALSLAAANQVLFETSATDGVHLNRALLAEAASDSVDDDVVYTTSFEDSASAAKMVILDLNEDPADEKNGKWGRTLNGLFSMFSRTGNYSMVYFYSKKNPGNDWFILEPVQLKAGYYALKFWYSSDHEENLSVYWGEKPEADALTKEIVRYDNFVEPKYVESANVVHVEKDGVYYFGFKSESRADENIICIDDVSIVRIKNTDPDVSVTQLSSSNGYVCREMSQDVVFAVTNQGIQEMKDSKVKATLDNQVIFEEPVSLKGQETRKFVVEGALAKLEAGNHTLHISVVNDADKNAENNTVDYSFKVVQNPKVMYDFEGGKVPEGFVLKVADKGTVDKGLADIFPGNEAWNLVKIVEHPHFGEWMLAAGSWLEGGVAADRWCILPKLHVGSDKADLTWTANSADTNFKFAEDYEVLVSVTDTELSSFTKVAEVKKENFATDPSTRGISLSEYAGKDIYVAFRLVTADGYFMALDNVAFYGDVAGDGSGIESAESEELVMVQRGNELVCLADNVENIELFDVSGRLVRSSQGESSVEIGSLEQGVFVARVKADGKVLLHKFSK